MKRYPDRGLHGRLVEAFGSQIVGGVLPAGNTIDTESVTREFDVSRTVVREALKVLAGKGLLDARPRRGTFVSDRSNWNLLDPDVLRWQFMGDENHELLSKLHELRVIVEPASAELAAERRSEGDLVRLYAAIETIGRSGATADEIVQGDLDFHLGLIAATKNELVDQLSTLISIGLSARDRFVHDHEVPLENSLQMHRDVANAIRDREPARARQLMFRLLEGAELDVRQARAQE